MTKTYVLEPHEEEEALRIAARELRKVHDGKALNVVVSRSFDNWIIIRTTLADQEVTS